MPPGRERALRREEEAAPPALTPPCGPRPREAPQSSRPGKAGGGGLARWKPRQTALRGPRGASRPRGASVWGAWDAYLPTGQGTRRDRESPGSTSLSEQAPASTASRPGATDSRDPGPQRRLTVQQPDDGTSPYPPACPHRPVSVVFPTHAVIPAFPSPRELPALRDPV